MYSFCGIFTLFQNFQFWTLWSFLVNFPEPIFVFCHFGGQKFKIWKILQKIKILSVWKLIIIFHKIFHFLNFWPPKWQKTKIGSGKLAKNDPKVQNWKFWKKVKLPQKLYKFLAFYKIFLISNPFCLKRMKMKIFRVIFGDF